MCTLQRFFPPTTCKYIFVELWLPFFASCGIILFILLMGKMIHMVDLVLNKGVSVGEITNLIIHSIPSLVVVCLPISLLVAILVLFNHMNLSGELIALKSMGLSPLGISTPVIFATLLIFSLSLINTLVLLPKANFSLQKNIFKITCRHATLAIKEGVFNHMFGDLTIFVNKISKKGDELNDVFIVDSRNAESEQVIVARNATITSDEDSMRVVLALHNGAVHKKGMNNWDKYRMMNFASYYIPLNLVDISGKKVRKHKREMNVGELKKRIHMLKKLGQNYNPELVSLHQRFSMPFSCFVFSLLATTFGMRSRITAKISGVNLAMIIVLTYFLMLNAMKAWAVEGKLFPLLAVWLPNILFGILGSYLFYQACKRVE